MVENKHRKFAEYRREKRLEITSMQTIINTFGSDLREKEVDLLIASYIVLTYAYWESCYQYLNELIFEKYKTIPIKDLPYDMNNDVCLKLALHEINGNSTNPISSISSYRGFFVKASNYIKENESSSLQAINMDDHCKHIFMVQTQNPKIDDLKKMLNKIQVNFERLNILDGDYSAFKEQLDFIIMQRNAIAHKNNHISYNGTSYNSYLECITSIWDYNNSNNEITMRITFSTSIIAAIGEKIDTLFRELSALVI